MAFTAAVSVLNSVSKIPVAGTKWCFGTLSFTAGDVYTAGGFDIRPLIRKLFGVSRVLHIQFLGTSSINGTVSTFNTARVLAKYTSATTGIVKLLALGRTTAGAAVASDVEINTNDNVRNAAGAGLTFPFWAICSGEGTTIDSTMGPG